MSTNLSLHYHLIFSAKHREPWLSPSLRIAVHEYLAGIVKGQSAETRASCCDPVGIECVVKPDSGGAGTPGCDAEDASGIASKMSKLQIMSKAWPGTGGNAKTGMRNAITLIQNPHQQNDVIKLQLYSKDDVWFFDAPEHGLKAEPFVGTTNNIIDMAIEKAGKNLEQAKENGVTISFSFAKVPPQLNAVECHYVEGDHRWSLYKVVNEPDELSGWLCPSLWHYTPEENGAPPIISVWV